MPSYDSDAAIDTIDNEEEEWEPAYWLNGQPMRFVAYWSGRGLHFEIGSRAYLGSTQILWD